MREIKRDTTQRTGRPGGEFKPHDVESFLSLFLSSFACQLGLALSFSLSFLGYVPRS
jgi:hypothetical protein